ncbi:MAG TPA: hypothetical protein VI670_11500 [Thermoanaerobaculia bacterium]|jgi:hypothetical protein
MDPLRVRAAIRRYGATHPGYEAEFLVDSPTIDVVAPASDLIRAGIERRPNENYGFAQIELLGVVTVGRVIFGAEGTKPILGTLLFESLFVVDPSTHAITRRNGRLPGIRPARSR